LVWITYPGGVLKARIKGDTAYYIFPQASDCIELWVVSDVNITLVGYFPDMGEAKAAARAV
jgi:hypothetical protein